MLASFFKFHGQRLALQLADNKNKYLDSRNTTSYYNLIIQNCKKRIFNKSVTIDLVFCDSFYCINKSMYLMLLYKYRRNYLHVQKSFIKKSILY